MVATSKQFAVSVCLLLLLLMLLLLLLMLCVLLLLLLLLMSVVVDIVVDVVVACWLYGFDCFRSLKQCEGPNSNLVVKG